MIKYRFYQMNNSMFTAVDYEYMIRAIGLARLGLLTTDPNPRVGCVLVKNNQIIGEGWHVRAGHAHAEISALQQAGAAAEDATVYVSLEPCCHKGKTPPCTEALIKSGVKNVIVAMHDPNPLVAGKGIQQLQEAGIEVRTGLLESEAAALNPGFIMRFTRKKPYVRLKMAMSLDGRTALASGESQWITGKDARDDVQRLRARSSAIMTGIGTIMMDDPALNVRFDSIVAEMPDHGVVRQPLRIVMDSQLKLPAHAKTLKLPGDVLVITSVSERSRIDKFLKKIKRDNLEVIQVPVDEYARPDLQVVMSILAEGGINELHVECGPTLAGALLMLNLIDEFVFYWAPHILGSTGKAMFVIPELPNMENRISLRIEEVRKVGSDYRISAVPASITR